MQLVAYGAQDIYLTGNPQITFFKVVYRRHTNFSMETISQTLDGNNTLSDSNNEATCTIARNGDLIHKMYITSISSGIICGSKIINSVELEIGGQKIDKHTEEWNNVWNELTLTNNKGLALKDMLSENYTIRDGKEQLIQLPLNFYFCKNPGLALPLIALQYHEVKINIKFCEAKDIFSQTADGGAITAAGANHSLSEGKLFVQYIYLDTDERRRFAQVSHEYLIEQLQFQNETGNGSTFTLNFNHPVKEIIWGGSPLPTGTCSGANVTNAAPPVSGPTVLSPFKAGNNPGTDNTSVLAAGFTDSMNGSIDYNFSTQGGNAVNSGTWQLKLNGHDRFEPRPITYFSRQQIYDHHTGFGCIPSKDSILVYSFALKPEEHQPSGTCNFSRIDSAKLDIETAAGMTTACKIYAVNYNVLRIMSGMGGLAYSN